MDRRFAQIIAFAISFVLAMQPMAWGADTSIATISLSGNVPVIFSVTARGIPGDLDLTPGSIVSNRLLALFSFRFNADAASIKISSSTNSGMPEKGGTAYPFKTGGEFKVAFSSGCVAVHDTYESSFTLTAAGTDVKSATAAGLTTSGIDETCSLYGSWSGTTASLPLSGTYSMSITITMISN